MHVLSYAGEADRHAYQIIAARDASLRQLRTDCIDFYRTHVLDAAIPIEEALRA
jgi:aryl-alcohol dehydrogenase-like predicted oxidoreductase